MRTELNEDDMLQIEIDLYENIEEYLYNDNTLRTLLPRHLLIKASI